MPANQVTIPPAYTVQELERYCEQQSSTPFLVRDMLPVESLAILGGDSGIGKSALLYQLGLCVAAGVPFLGLKTTQAPVLYWDLENPASDAIQMQRALKVHLNVPESLDAFRTCREPDPHALSGLVQRYKPQLVIVDSLRAFVPQAAENNGDAAEMLNRLRQLALTKHTAFLILHHVKKPREDRKTLVLEVTPAVTWLNELSGARALVNQTDVRIAVAASTIEGVALEARWHRRIFGDSEVLRIERNYDGNGEPTGYALAGLQVILGSERFAAYTALPETFAHKDAHRILGGGKSRTQAFLRACTQAGGVEKLPNGGYRKLPARC